MAGGTLNLSAVLLDAHLARGDGGRVAIRFEGRSISYAELAGLVARTGHVLRELGVERGERVALLLGDRPEFIATFLATVRIGAVAVPLGTFLHGPDAIALIRHCGAVALVAETAFVDELLPLLPSAPDLRSVLAVGGDAPDALSLERLSANAPGTLVPADTTREDMCFWQYSSGTTGRPKAVMHRHGDLEAITDLYGRAVLGITRDDRSFSASKLYFSYGLGNSLAFPLRYGANVVLSPMRPDPRTAFELVRRERPTLLYAVPTGYAQLLAAAEAEPALADLSSVRLCISAGEALPAPLFERWRARFGHEILDGIGSTEVGYIFISNVPGDVRPGTSGRVVPGYVAKVADAAGRPVPDGETGDLWVRGPSTFTGYWGDDAATSRAIRDGWVVTGDKYARDADGYFRWAGRSDDMMKVGGVWVAPAVVEAAVCAHPSVLECAVVGRVDTEGLIKPAAFVTLRPGASATADEIVEYVAHRIAPFMRPRWVHFVRDLPKTATGKIQRYKLRENAARSPRGIEEVVT
jgi:benzoate-CoA ligase family protein